MTVPLSTSQLTISTKQLPATMFNVKCFRSIILEYNEPLLKLKNNHNTKN